MRVKTHRLLADRVSGPTVMIDVRHGIGNSRVESRRNNIEWRAHNWSYTSFRRILKKLILCITYYNCYLVHFFAKQPFWAAEGRWSGNDSARHTPFGPVKVKRDGDMPSDTFRLFGSKVEERTCCSSLIAGYPWVLALGKHLVGIRFSTILLWFIANIENNDLCEIFEFQVSKCKFCKGDCFNLHFFPVQYLNRCRPFLNNPLVISVATTSLTARGGGIVGFNSAERNHYASVDSFQNFVSF